MSCCPFPQSLDCKDNKLVNITQKSWAALTNQIARNVIVTSKFMLISNST